MRARSAHLGIALAAFSTLVATAFVVASGGEPLALLLFAGALVSVLALEVRLRAAPVVVGVVFVMFGTLLWSSGGVYALLCGLLLVGSAAAGPREERQASAAGG